MFHPISVIWHTWMNEFVILIKKSNTWNYKRWKILGIKKLELAEPFGIGLKECSSCHSCVCQQNTHHEWYFGSVQQMTVWHKIQSCLQTWLWEKLGGRKCSGYSAVHWRVSASAGVTYQLAFDSINNRVSNVGQVNNILWLAMLILKGHADLLDSLNRINTKCSSPCQHWTGLDKLKNNLFQVVT